MKKFITILSCLFWISLIFGESQENQIIKAIENSEYETVTDLLKNKKLNRKELLNYIDHSKKVYDSLAFARANQIRGWVELFLLNLRNPITIIPKIALKIVLGDIGYINKEIIIGLMGFAGTIYAASLHEPPKYNPPKAIIYSAATISILLYLKGRIKNWRDSDLSKKLDDALLIFKYLSGDKTTQNKIPQEVSVV